MNEIDVFRGMVLELFTRHHSSYERLLAERVGHVAALIERLSSLNEKGFIKMSDTFHTDLADNKAAMAELTQEVTDGLAANVVAIEALRAQIAAGSPVTDQDLADIVGGTAAARDATATLHAALNPVVPTP